MRSVRIFSSSPLQVGAPAELGRTAAAHVGQALRMRAGQPLTLFDGAGGEYAATIIECTRQTLRVAVTEHHPLERETPLAVTLWPALARGARMDTIIQKATELGAEAIQPVLTERSVVRLDERRAAGKVRHWRDVAISACEQCGRNRVPLIHPPAALATLLAAPPEPGLRLMLDPQGQTSLAAQQLAPGPLLLLSGPEGGLSEDELRLAAQSGFVGVRLGPRILRTETAPLAALAAVQVLGGDLGVSAEAPGRGTL